MSKQQKSFVNWSEYMDKNQPQIDAMGAKLDAQQQNIGDYANRARSELKQATVAKAGAGEWDGDYTKLPEWKNYQDSTNAYQDYQLGQRNQGMRDLELQNEYQGQGGSTAADAALLYRRGNRQAKNQQTMQGWNSYLDGLEQISGEAAGRYATSQAAAAQQAKIQANQALAHQLAEQANRAAANKAAGYDTRKNYNPVTGRVTENIDNDYSRNSPNAAQNRDNTLRLRDNANAAATQAAKDKENLDASSAAVERARRIAQQQGRGNR